MRAPTRAVRLCSFAIAALAAIVVTGCQTLDSETTAEDAGLTDAQVVAAAEAINRAEIRQAELALNRSSDPQVRYVAGRMLEDHQRLSMEFRQLAYDAGIDPQPSPLSQSLQERAQQIQDRLNGLEGDAFDEAYLQAQAQMHQLALDTVSQELLPAAQDPGIRETLTAGRDRLEAHLETARSALEVPEPEQPVRGSLSRLPAGG